MLLINCSNREKNCFKILSGIKTDNDKIISLSGKDMKFCLGCLSCHEKLEKHCVIDDFITNYLYDEIINANDIVLATPMYMSDINGILKNLLDRLNPFYQHGLLKNKNIYLIITGGSSKEDNEEEIDDVIKYFEGISTWMYFNFKFIGYYESSNILNDTSYENIINEIKEKLY